MPSPRRLFAALACLSLFAVLPAARATEPLPVSQSPQSERQPSEPAISAVGADPITLTGSLTTDSPTLQDESHYGIHRFNGQANQIVVVEMTSDEFDAYLLLNDPQDQQIAKDDDGAGGNNARIVLKLSATGTYTIVANSARAAATGAYRLSIRTGTAQELAVAEVRTEADRLFNQGNQQFRVSQFREALQSWEQALQIYRKLGDRQGEANAIGSLGNAYLYLGQYQKAIDLYEQCLAIMRDIGDRQGEGSALGNLGLAYFSLGEYQKAIDLYQQQLVIVRDIGDRQGEGNAIGNLGSAYSSLGQYQKAIDLYQQQLVIVRDIGDRQGEGNALNNLGVTYRYLGQYPQAIAAYQQGLAIQQEIGDREGVGITLSNIGILLEKQNQPELAIVFLKQSVNVREEIRQGNQKLVQELQQSYTETVAGTYRKLADLLLQSNRILEAQQVLDLLKAQELKDYLQQTVRGPGPRSSTDYQPPEQRILDLYQQVITEGAELSSLRALPYSSLTPAQQQRLSQLVNREAEILQSFDAFTRRPEIVAALNQLRQTTSGQAIEISNFRALQNNLQQLQQNAVLLYPLILGDRLELVLVTATADAPIRVPVPVSAAELNRTILEFRQALQDPSQDAKPAAQQLHRWLIQPLQPYLDAAKAQTILYAPDGALRYVPLAALHDGNQWLAQRYAITHITAASLTSFDATPRAQPLRLLAAACAQCNFNFQVNNRPFNFANLPYAKTEVERLASVIPGTDTLLDQAFSPDATETRLGNYNIIHLATHAAFVQGLPDESFIVFGNGEKVTLRDIPGWNLQNADLVVLSACETGLGGFNFSDGLENRPGNAAANSAANPVSTGVEILGLGYQMQLAGAKAAIATLWSVNDGGTQMLMNALYTALENGMSKTEALRQAQTALITGDMTAVGMPRGSATVEIISRETGLPPQVSNNLDHPYYWAPFILIGNGR